MGVARIDLNADLAEECGGDDEIFPLLSSANICCGAHAGGPAAMQTAVSAARVHGVTIGAHVGYEDREHFGRIAVDIPPEELHSSMTKQLRALSAICDAEGVHMQYVKPHGALYHRVGSDPVQAQVVVDAVAAMDANLDLLVPNSPIVRRAAENAGVQCHFEYFADRGYNADGTLVDRRREGAMLTATNAIVERALRWLETGLVRCVDGHDIRVEATSICLHGDEQDAIASARALRSALDECGYAVRSWRAP